MKEHQFARPSDGDRSQGWAILAVCWAFVATALATTMLRVWVRLRLTRNLGWDDHYMMIAMVRNQSHAFPFAADELLGNDYHRRRSRYRRSYQRWLRST